VSTHRYTVPVDQTEWRLPGHATDVVFNWEYDTGRDRLLSLYEQGKDKQWNAARRIDWSIDVDFADQGVMPDYQVPIFGSDSWERLSRAEKDDLRHHMVAWLFSQFLHGEQGALICSAKIVETVPQVDAKFYAATQVIDEARHVELYARYLNDKVDLAYPINPYLATLLDQTISDSRWDLTYLGMQMMVEGVALGAFGMVRDLTEEPLTKAINALVMADEARHVAFGIAALSDAYRDLSSAERKDREDFVIEASWLLRDRFMAREVWERNGLDADECVAFMEQSLIMSEFRKKLFSRLVPSLKRIGLWGPRVQDTFVQMGVIDYQDLDPEDFFSEDERLAEELAMGVRAGQVAATIDAAGISAA